MTEPRARLRRHLPSGAFLGASAMLLAVLIAAAIWFGVYDVAADVPHSAPVFAVLETLRERSIAVRSRGITPPADLESPMRVSTGAGLYAEMCSNCHLGPGLEKTEISQGLYPSAPELAKASEIAPAGQFWIIKHGVKLSAMPAWGKTHSDTLIWDMVAFLRKLPAMTPAQYSAAVASAPADHDEMMKDMAATDRDTATKGFPRGHGR